MINGTTKIRCWFFFQISYQRVFPVQFVLWEQVTGNAMLLPSDRTTIGESLYVQCIKHISNTNSLICHSVIHRWILINRNKQFIKKNYKIVLLFEDMSYFYSRIKKKWIPWIQTPNTTARTKLFHILLYPQRVLSVIFILIKFHQSI